MAKCELEDFEESPSKWGKERMEPGQLEDLILATSFTLKSGLYEVPTSREFLIPFPSLRQMLLGHKRTCFRTFHDKERLKQILVLNAD